MKYSQFSNAQMFFFSDGDTKDLIEEFRTQLKKLAITDKLRKDEMFLRYNRDRLGFIDIECLKDICVKLQLPPDEEVLNAVSLPLFSNALNRHIYKYIRRIRRESLFIPDGIFDGLRQKMFTSYHDITVATLIAKYGLNSESRSTAVVGLLHLAK